MPSHESARPLPLSNELWASLIQSIRKGVSVARDHASSESECRDTVAAIEAVEAIEGMTPQSCLHCAIRDMLVVHAEAHAHDMLDEASAAGWDHGNPAHVNAQAVILRARLAALGMVAGELASGHRPYSTTPWLALVAAASDCLMAAFFNALPTDVGPAPPEPTPKQEPPGSTMSVFMDGLRPPKNKLH